MKTFKEAIEESTCQKRATVCEIYDANWILLSRESNRCNPEGGTCHRLGLVQNKDNYDKDSHCNWTHAEINAIAALPEGSTPFEAIVYGHNFACQNCENALKAAGVQRISISENL
jgi:deoxycytidylate deaminase